MKNSLLKAFALTLLISSAAHGMNGVDNTGNEQNQQNNNQQNNNTEIQNPGENPVDLIPEAPKGGYVESVKRAPKNLWNAYKSFVSNNWSSEYLDIHAVDTDIENNTDNGVRTKSKVQNILGKGKVVGAHVGVAGAIAAAAYWLLGLGEEVQQEEGTKDVTTGQTTETKTPVLGLKQAMMQGYKLAQKGEYKAVAGASETFNAAVKVIAASYKSCKTNGAEFNNAMKVVSSSINAIK